MKSARSQLYIVQFKHAQVVKDELVDIVQIIMTQKPQTIAVTALLKFYQPVAPEH